MKDEVSGWSLIVRHNTQVYRMRKSETLPVKTHEALVFIETHLRIMLGSKYALHLKRLIRFQLYSFCVIDLRICHLIRKSTTENPSDVIKAVHLLYKQKPLRGYF